MEATATFICWRGGQITTDQAMISTGKRYRRDLRGLTRNHATSQPRSARTWVSLMWLPDGSRKDESSPYGVSSG